MFLGNILRAVRDAGNFTAICQPTVYAMWDPHGPPWPVAEIALLFYMCMMLIPQHLTALQASTAYYGNSFTYLYEYDVGTSQETHL
jgi:hypothetical protein